jgi:sugar lactone lactonase YvrE
VKNRIHEVSAAAVMLLAAAIAGCGGGGGGGNPASYSVGGTVSGLAAGQSLTLTDNGSDVRTVSTNGAFTFPASLGGGASYAVSITAAPAQQNCTLSGGSGTVANSAVNSILVACIGPFSVGGTVSGLSSNTTLTVTDNGGDSFTISADGPFNFPTPLRPGASYAVAIATLPMGEQCGLAGAVGTVDTANAAGITITCVVPTLSLVAGALGGSGSRDGDRTTARFYEPEDVVSDGSGNLYVADDYNATIRKVDATGAVTTLAGKARQLGTADGTGAAARFNNPVGVAVDPNGNVYVVDAGVNTVRQISPSGVVRTLAGTPLVYGTADGTGPAAQFTNPTSIRWSSNGSLYLTDNTRIRNITTGGVVTTVYSGGAQLSGLDVSNSGFALVSDITTKSALKIDWSTGAATTLASGFQLPIGIAAAPPSSPAAGTIYVADAFASTLDAISSNGVLSTLAGSPNSYGYLDGAGAAARFYSPAFISLNGAGLLLVADSGANTIRQVTSTGVVTTIAGHATQAGNVNGAGSIARFNNPESLLSDAAGNLYVGDSNGIRKVTASGQTTTAYSPSGAIGLALDAKDKLYFTAYPNSAVQVIAADGSITVFAGSQLAGYADGTGTAASFSAPFGLAMDAAGNLFVADTGNAAIRKITPSGIVTTFAGFPGNPAGTDGIGQAAGFKSPFAIAIDSNGTIFVTDGNAIRKITSSGTVTTLAGSQTAGFADGAGTAAQFNSPGGIAIGPAGAIFVSDGGNNCIRKISATGVVTTLIGVAGQSGVKLGPLPTTLNVPVGLSYVGSTLYVVEAAENSVLAISGVF